MGSLNNVYKNIKLFMKSISLDRDEKIVLFGSWFGERFADTSRFLFQYLSENKENLGLEHVVWVTRREDVLKTIREMGYEAYMIGSKESDEYHYKAKYHIICNRANNGAGFLGDIDGTKSFGAKRLNLWHGVMPLKGVGNATNAYKCYKKSHPYIVTFKEFLSDYSLVYRLFFHDLGGWGDCFYLSVTPEGTRILKKFFRMPNNHYIETSNPRIAPCLKLTTEEERIIDKIKSYKYAILYAPTFRDVDSSFDFYEAGRLLAGKLEKEGTLWIQKPHTAAIVESSENCKNILDLPSEVDLNVILPYISVLITDYSSIAADAMFYNMPIFYYMPDYEEYQRKDRGFIEDPKKNMVSDMLTTSEELEKELLYYFNKPEEYKFSPKYKEIVDKYWGESKSYNEIWQDIKEKMK